MQTISVTSYQYFRMICFIAAIELFLLLVVACSTSGTIYYVTPDDKDDDNDDYSAMDDNSVYTLQCFVSHFDEYFIDNTTLYLLPGEHHLNGDIIIQDVYNFSIIGSETYGAINSTINCTSAAGIAVINCKYIFLSNLRMIKCVSNLNGWLTDALGSNEAVSMFMLNSWFVSIVNIYFSQSHKRSACGIWSLNLGKSTLSNTKIVWK